VRIKLDESLPERLTSVLRELGHDLDTVREEGLRGQDDDVPWPKVQEAQRFLITKDLGFSDAIHRGVTTA
jgi:predicted nuclease of predicted toxin-antitoxin system